MNEEKLLIEPSEGKEEDESMGSLHSRCCCAIAGHTECGKNTETNLSANERVYILPLHFLIY
jgi:hypothetical protein